MRARRKISMWLAGGVALHAGAACPAIVQEDVAFSSVLSRGPLGSAFNDVRTTTFSGGYTATRILMSGTLEPIAPGTWASDARVLVTPPGRPGFILQPFTTEGFSSPLTVTRFSYEFDQPIAQVGGTWSFRFFESFVDVSSGDARWTNLLFELDDAPPPPRWVEAPDAPELPLTAQTAAGNGVLTQIRGTVLGDDADLYVIEICDPSNFSASTVQGAAWDTQLYLFRQDGQGVAFNDDSPSDPVSQSRLSSTFVPQAGRYLLGVTRFDRHPIDSFGRELWQPEPFAQERFPDGTGAGSVLAGWQTTTFGQAGQYTIYLTGTCFVSEAPACVADFDDGFSTGVPDGAVTIDDLIFYLDIFAQGLPRSDVDDGSGTNTRDGGVTVDDLIYFLARFEQGC